MLRRVLAGFHRCNTRVHQKKVGGRYWFPVSFLAVNRICSWSATSSFLNLRQLQPVYHPQVRQISKKDYNFPEVKESDLEEKFVLGQGPGGQAVQKTANCVVLKHIPTNIIVKCHATRSQEKNRQIARERLCEQLDDHYNGENSFENLRKKEEKIKHVKREKKARQRLELKKAFKQREDLD